MDTAAFAESFAPIVQCEKKEIHSVFPLFSHFPLGQNLSAKALAPLCGIAIRKRQTHGIHVVCLFMQNFYQIRALEKEYTTNLPKNSLGWVIDGRSMYWTVRFLMSGTVFPL